jgi:hypothetical protein
MTTASPSGAPVAISAHVPRTMVVRGIWPVKMRSTIRRRAGESTDAAAASAATSA